MTPQALADAIEGSLEIYSPKDRSTYATMIAALRHGRVVRGAQFDEYVWGGYTTKVNDQGQVTVSRPAPRRSVTGIESPNQPKPEPPKREPETSPIAAGCGALDFEGLDRSLKP